MAVNKPDPSADKRVGGLSPTARRLLLEGGKALSGGQPDDAERALIGVLAMAPQCAEANRLMGILAQMRGDFRQGVAFLEQARAACPDDALILMSLGSALYETGAIAAALSALRRATELAPGFASAWYNLGKALKLQLDAGHARQAFERALAIDPAHITARTSLADVQISQGDIDQATVNFRDVLRRQPDHADTWFALANLKTTRFTDNDSARLRQLFRQPGTAPEARVAIGFALAKALEDQGDMAASFDILAEANSLQLRRVSWSAAAQKKHVQAIAAAFERPFAAPQDSRLGEEVIFIVGVPRSGSTLIEQILASHPLVEGANEILDLPQVIEEESRRRGMPFPNWVGAATPDDWARLGQDYLQRTRRWRQHRPRFTDKNLVTWEMVGAIAQMLPGAHIIHSRRDPLETCLACYRQLFSYGAYFSYDLDDMASYFIDHERLLRFWQQRLPARIFQHDYETLQNDTEAQVRRLLAFCGLDFDPACLAFHQTSRTVLSTASAAQVRQPLRRDTARSALYGAKLDRLRTLLRDLPTR